MPETTVQIGHEYETFTQEIYESIRKIEDIGLVKPRKIERNVKLHTKYGCEREIDLYWEFIREGRLRKAAIECKNYKTAVPVEKIDAFVTKIADLEIDYPMFFAKHGFQDAAIKCAQHHKIQIIELRTPEKKDMEGRIQHITCRMNIEFPPKILEANIYVNKGDEGPIEATTNDPIVDEKGKTIGSINSFVQEDSNGKIPGVHIIGKELNNCKFISPSKEIPISRITIKYEKHPPQTKTLEIDYTDVIRAILKVIGIGDFYVSPRGSLREICDTPTTHS